MDRSSVFDPPTKMHYRKIFLRYDMDGDDRISIAEFCKVMSHLGDQWDKEKLKTAVLALDAEEHGISYTDFLGILSNSIKDSTKEKEMYEVFKLVDTDGNGFISKSELCAALKKMDPTLQDDEIDSIFHDADTDHDGQIDFEEFEVMMATRDAVDE